MRLKVDFSALKRCIEQMGAEPVEFNIGKVSFEDPEIDAQLEVGIAIKSDEVQFTDRVLSYYGRQVLLYIPDQGKKIDKVLLNPEEGRRFHVADCETLEKMRRENRFDRYIVTNDLSGAFKVHGIDKFTGEERHGIAHLKVCKNCLKALNYKGYCVKPKSAQNEIFRTFNLSEFFEDYSTLFKQLPKRFNAIYASNYPDNWKEISRNYRESKHYICESCHTNFAEHKNLLVTHHINGVKSDNFFSNLKALCLDCHRKEPKHDHLFISREDMETIYRLRRVQGKMVIRTWEDAFKLSDKALHGFLEAMRAKGKEIPEIGYFHTLPNGDDILLDIAWPHRKQAVVEVAGKKDIPGWTIWTLGEALKMVLE
ncbi:MAG: hypothetical protein DSY46_00745 [Hydrogenimonas sp.]|nr:MAG: hypothetical protein DSY46_00745 [Hydrogenimonas sp.]